MIDDIEIKTERVDLDDADRAKYEEDLRAMGYDPDKVIYHGRYSVCFVVSDKCKKRERKIGYQKAIDGMVKAAGKYASMPTESEDNSVPASNFSALEWGTIFFYAVGCRLTPGAGDVASSLRSFYDKHKLRIAFKSFRNSYYKAKTQLNYNNTNPPGPLITRLNTIIPFLNDNYPQSVSYVEGDIKIINESTD